MTTMTATLKDELMELETRFWDAMRNRDGKAVADLTADTCTIVGASGATAIDPSTMAQMLDSAEWRIRSYRIDSASVRVQPISDDTALIAYSVHEDVSVDGKDLGMDAFDASIWQRQGGRWMCVLHTESIAGDAFGRDRTS